MLKEHLLIIWMKTLYVNDCCVLIVIFIQIFFYNLCVAIGCQNFLLSLSVFRQACPVLSTMGPSFSNPWSPAVIY